MRIEQREIVLKTGETVVIRSAKPEEAEKIRKLRETTSAETHFMAREPEDGQMDRERIRSITEAVYNSEKDFYVTAFLGEEVIGDLGVVMIRPQIKFRHRAYLGMSILQKYTSMGLGSVMMETAIEQAKKNGFEQVELGVFEDNEKARGLYKKFGFKEYGVNPRAFKLPDGSYHDEIIMMRLL
ncbi:MAG: GNAT family N-acetyltransferase [Lachnospiraceae bacterium]|nr:GNAT family N-acetyltransferase [Lachnospiraceae bacterium]SFQ29347.1 L-amino acid N-acyltransferase YncA [Lachnospiraceae bacterium XBB1006]